VDVGAIDRGDPLLVEARDRVVGDLVARMLGVVNFAREIDRALRLAQHFDQELGCLDDAGRVLFERLVKDAVAPASSDTQHEFAVSWAGGSLVTRSCPANRFVADSSK
jgi:hypothetical protein